MFKSLITLTLSLTLLQTYVEPVLASPNAHHVNLARHMSRKPHALIRRQSNRNSSCQAIAASNKKYLNQTSVASGSLSTSGPTLSSTGNCFPALGFQMPGSVPSSANGWWCDPSTEYAFVGFGYEITACQSQDQLTKEFTDIRQRFNGRYVRLYGTCDTDGYYNSVIEAAWDAGIGVHPVVWFGFLGDNSWQGRRDALFSVLHSNPKAPFVVRTIQFGSEPLYDHAIDPYDLASQVKSAQGEFKSLGITVTVSDMAYGFQNAGAGGVAVLQQVDNVHAHMLPFFSTDATTGSNAWPIIDPDIQWFQTTAGNKKIYFSENGWPSESYAGVQANSGAAVADVDSESQYFGLLDSKCEYFKSFPNGIAWFAHLYSDNQEPGYGILDTSGNPKFAFSPRTSC